MDPTEYGKLSTEMLTKGEWIAEVTSKDERIPVRYADLIKTLKTFETTKIFPTNVTFNMTLVVSTNVIFQIATPELKLQIVVVNRKYGYTKGPLVTDYASLPTHVLAYIVEMRTKFENWKNGS